jgi:tight adherence protein C
MALLISSLLFVVLACGLSLLGYYWYVRAGRVSQQLGTVSSAVTGLSADRYDPMQRVAVSLQWVGEQVPISPQDASLTRRMLMGAGYRSEAALPVYLGGKVLCCVAFLAAALVGRTHIANPLLSMLLPVGAVVVGYLLPGLFLDMLINRRQHILRMSLPDALDLMVVCAEAGLGLDQAMRVVSRELALTHKEISEEFGLVSLEMRAGTRRADALVNLGKRTGEAEIKKLVSLLVQSDRFGTSMAEALRTHSEFMRVRRRQEAEERANKIGVKIIFPIFFLILPSIILVAIGPALIQLHKNLLPMLHGTNLK